MSVTEVKQAIGRWDLRLNEETPVTLLDKLTYFGHIALIPGQVDVAQYGDNLLTAARYVGVLRGRDQQNTFKLIGNGMAFWLGDEEDKGDVYETLINITAQTFPNTIRALLPVGGAITEGTLYSAAGTYTGTHQWVTPRTAITYVTELFGAEWRVNFNGTLDAGPIGNLYVTAPKTLILPKGFGSDLFRRAISGVQSMATDVADTTTRVVLLAEGEGTNIATAAANAPATSYKDIHGNALKVTRLVSESSTEAGNAAARAQLQLNRFLNPRRAVDLSTDEYDVKGTFVVGDYVDVYDPVNGFYDAAREIYWEGERINPMALRCVEMTWPIPVGWTVAFRDVNGVWYDLSDHYVPEEGDTTIVVGELSRGLSGVGGEAVGVRPNLPDATPSIDTTIPAAPVFTSFSTGIYETLDRSLAAVQATWSQPLNTDSSTITDGDHYELRYRPNAIIGTPIPWDLLSGEYATDYDEQFNTPVVGGLGTGWALIGAGSEFNVAGGEAQVSHPTTDTLRGAYRWNTIQSPRVEIRMDSSIDYMPDGGSTVMGSWFRYDGSNYYWWRVEPNVDASVTLKLWRYKAAVFTEVVSMKVPGMVHTPGVRYHSKATLYDDTLTYKVWQGTTSDEPAEDQVNYWDQDPITGTGCVGFFDYIVFGSTNAGEVIRHSYIQARSLDPDNVANAYSWDDLGTWDAPTSEPVAVTPNWSIAYAGWDQNTYTITELGAGIKYEFQIRAVDSASPPHQGAWSPSSYVNTSGDVIAPSTPAAPIVAASMIAVQIEHRLGKASGGAFNLEQDLAKLEVHASHTPTFTPSASTKVGDLLATGAMVRSGIPAVGTFKVDQAGSVWIRVVAVDRMGNTSGPSDAVQSSVDLIDDAHITSLSVSKLTAGTITANTVLAAEMEVGAGGNIKLTEGSVDVFNNLSVKNAEIGLLSDGTYGISLVNAAGEFVKLHNFIFGPEKAEKSTPGFTSSATYTNLDDGTGPALSGIVIGDLGRAIVTLTAYMEAPSGGMALMGLEIRNTITNSVVQLPDDLDSLSVGGGSSSGSIRTVGRASVEIFVEGLSAGTYTFTAKYRAEIVSGGSALFANRVIKVQPY